MLTVVLVPLRLTRKIFSWRLVDFSEQEEEEEPKEGAPSTAGEVPP